MSENRSRYRALERFLTTLLLIAVGLFVLYLLSASLGWTAVKILCAVAAILVSAYGVWNLYSTKELLRQRSLWLTCAFGSVILCTVVSLLCNFPRP